MPIPIHFNTKLKFIDFYNFFISEKKQPQKGDWYSEIKAILEDFEITIKDDEINK